MITFENKAPMLNLECKADNKLSAKEVNKKPFKSRNSPFRRTKKKYYIHYLGLTLCRRITWSPYVKMKRETPNRLLKLFYPLFSNSSIHKPAH